MIKDVKLLFLLLRQALYHGYDELPVSLTAEDASQLFEITEKQAVSGLVIEVLTRNNADMPQARILKAIGLRDQIKAQC